MASAQQAGFRIQTHALLAKALDQPHIPPAKGTNHSSEGNEAFVERSIKFLIASRKRSTSRMLPRRHAGCPVTTLVSIPRYLKYSRYNSAKLSSSGRFCSRAINLARAGSAFAT